MAKLSEQIQKSFVERLGRLTRSTTSLRARIKDSFARSDTTVSAPVRESVPVEVRRVSNVPDGVRVYAIGDIHGRCDLLQELVTRIEDDCADLTNGMKCRIVFLGDYIDRGLQSRDVIEFLLSDRLKNFDTVFLKGNHEEAMLRFLEDASFGKQWVQYGGGETLYSYGFQPPNTRASLSSRDAMAAAETAWETLWNGFRESFPPEHRHFLDTLETHHLAGDYYFVHAGVRPGVPIENQSVRDQLWIRDEFLDAQNQFDHVIVHGHTPEADIYRDDRRIGLDTGAFISGKLSAAKLQGSDVSFLSTGSV